MGAADYADDSNLHEPPPELTLWFWMRDFPGSLPEPGGLRDQPAGLLPAVRQAGRVWSIFADYNSPGVKWKDFQRKRPADWKIKHWIDRLRQRRDG